MSDFKYNKELQSKHVEFSKKYPDCKKNLSKVAYEIYQLKKEKINLPEELTLKSLKPAIENSFVILDSAEIQFSDRVTFLYFLANYFIDFQLMKNWSNTSKFVGNLRKIRKPYIKFGYLRDLDAIILVVLNNEYKKNICSKIASLTKEDNRIFWDIYDPFVKALPFLHLDAASLICALVNVQKLTKNDLTRGLIFKAMEKLSKEDPPIGIALYQKFIKKPLSDAVYFIPSILVGLSDKIELDKVYPWGFDLMDEKDVRLIQAGILSCSCFDCSRDKNKTLLKKTLKKFDLLFTDKRKEVLSALAKGFGNLIKVSEEAKEQLVKLSELQVPEVQYEISSVLFQNNKKLYSEEWFKKSINNLSTVDIKYEMINSNIVFSLQVYMENDPWFIISFLNLWIQNHRIDEIEKERDKLHIFNRLFCEIYNKDKSVIEKILVQWFSNDDRRFQSMASNIVREFSIRKVYLKLDKDELKGLSIQEVDFIVKKILGYVLDSKSLCGLVFSVLKYRRKRKKLKEIVTQAFIDFVVYNYPQDGKEFLEERLKKASSFEKQIINEILNKTESYWERINKLPYLKEFEPPDMRRRKFENAKFKKKQELLKKAEDETTLFKIIPKIILKGGATHFTKIDGKYTEESSLSEYKYFLPVPRLSLIDPVEFKYLRFKRRTLKKINPQNEISNT